MLELDTATPVLCNVSNEKVPIEKFTQPATATSTAFLAFVEASMKFALVSEFVVVVILPRQHQADEHKHLPIMTTSRFRK